MKVQVRNSRGGYVTEDVQHINLRSDGSLVLRYSGHKETVQDDEYSGFEVSPEA